MIKSSYDVIKYARVTTVFEDGSVTDRDYTIGDVIENLRYVVDGEVKVVSGRVKDIKYTLPTKSSYDARNPKDTIPDDVNLTNLILDTSEVFNAKSETVPFMEIVEFEEEENVERMRFSPYIIVKMELRYSNHTVQNVSIQAGDTFDKVKIMGTTPGSADLVGKFLVIGFSYTTKNNNLDVTGLIMRDLDTEKLYTIAFNRILSLNEVYNYTISETGDVTELVESLNDGDTITIDDEIDLSTTLLNLDKKNVSVALNENLVVDGKKSTGIRVTGGSTTLNGTGIIVNNTAYVAGAGGNGSGAISVAGDGKLTFNGSGIQAVIADDPVNKGQFGVTVYDNAELEINAGDFVAGWYCVSANGSKTTADAVTTINGGRFVSVADYAIYHPHAGKLVINGGDISGAAGALAANNGIIEINGGSFTATGGGNTGDASDGTGGLGNAALNLNAKYGDIACRINGGIFTATGDDTILIAVGSAHAVDIKITGGKFSTKPSDEWIAEGYLCTGEAGEDGYYTVYKALQ